ncbi:MAG: hybrid sensor histidine kinase/response regulator, partial [Gammaproteobacteria bacterium]
EPSQPSEQPPVETRVEAEIEAIPAQIEMVSEPPAPASEAATTRADAVRVDVDLLGGLVNLAGEVSIYRSRLEQKLGTFQFNLGELDQTVTRLKDQLRHLDIETEAQILSRFDRDKDDRADDFDPLEFDRFSQLQQLSRGLMESITDVLNLKHVLDEETRETETLLVQQARVNTNLQEGLMRTRMVPFSGLVPRLRRILRQTSRELGKRAELDVTGGEGELDRSVLERITAPLEHMVRNAVFHGIETPEVREAAGKSPIGKLTISLSRRGPEMIIRVTDDGQGIDIEAVRRKATERGLIDSGMEISDHDLQQVIMEPGFTTAKKVTQISGRGVGMDVVYSELKQLGGSLEIDSTASGTSFTMYLPFTLAVNRALLARVADEVYAVPLAALDGVVRLGRQDLERVYSAETPLYQYGGETYLVQYLGAMVGSSLPDLPDKGETLPVLLIRAGDQRVALQVDGLMGSREIVVKSLGPQLAKVPGIAGATILGDGRVVLILEVSTLLRREVSPQYQRLRKMAEKRKASQGAAPVKVMVVDDSITMRKVATRLLERQGMEVTTAKDGVDALARLHETVPDVMLLDIEMPRMDGYELAGRMRRDPRFEEIPIIMITSRTGSKHRDRATELGVNRYLGKPYQEADLLHHIRELAAEVRAKQ